MCDPFKIDSPTCISFSGGRTSAYMLWRVLQSNGGLPDEAIVCFANTGKEDEKTLEFVRDCSVNWDVPITWIEYRDDEQGYLIVDFDTAARNGEPFESIIRKYGFLPNPMARFCTVSLKIRPMAKYLKFIGLTETASEGENFSMIGIRADEQRRAAKIPDKSRVPLVTAQITKEIVGDFWKQHSFDLGLANINGESYEGNCDLCMLKNTHKIQALINAKPERAIWWAKMESLAVNLGAEPSGSVFRTDRPNYAKMMQYAKQQQNLFDPQEEAISCFCGD